VAGGDRSRDERVESHADDAAPDRRPGYQAHHETRALSREAIARSADLQRRYAVEYVSMLRAVRDRELAKEAARVNVSALLFGHPRIVPQEVRVNGRQLQKALGRGGEDLAAIRRAVSVLLSPEISRVSPRGFERLGPER
jgi:hypothetical protein